MNQLEPLLIKMAKLIAERDLDADQCMEEINQYLDRSDLREDLKTLDSMISVFDFDGAQEVLNRIADSLDIPLSKGGKNGE